MLWIVVDLHLKSDYAHWLNKELMLDGRRRSGFVWRHTFVPNLVWWKRREEEAAPE
jgi:hypothetical protein